MRRKTEDFFSRIFPFSLFIRWGIYYLFQSMRMIILSFMWVLFLSNIPFYLPIPIIILFVIDFIDGGVTIKFTTKKRYRIFDGIVDTLIYISLFYMCLNFWNFLSAYIILWIPLYFLTTIGRFFYSEIVLFKPSSVILFTLALSEMLTPDLNLVIAFLSLTFNPLLEYLIHLWQVGKWKSKMMTRVYLLIGSIVFYSLIGLLLFFNFL